MARHSASQVDGVARAQTLCDDLVIVRRQLAAAAASPAVAAAYQLTADVTYMLEPVWTVLSAAEPSGGVGYLRSLGSATPAPQTTRSNADVVVAVVERYRGLNLVAPHAREVWRQLARPSTALVASIRADREVAERPDQDTITPTVRPVLPPRLLEAWDDQSDVVSRLRHVLCRWCDLARHATGERREVARLTLAAAMLARGAALDGDVATVEWFVHHWLGLRATESRVDGTSAALLEKGWTFRSVDDHFSVVRDTVTDLRIEAKYQHRLHRPIWETQLGRMHIGLLSELDDAGESITAGIPAVEASPEDAAAVKMRNQQTACVLNTLPEIERAVVWAIQLGKSITEIARELSLSRYRVEQIRDTAMKKLRHPSRTGFLRDYLD
jgi:hypothetical protein